MLELTPTCCFLTVFPQKPSASKDAAWSTGRAACRGNASKSPPCFEFVPFVYRVVELSAGVESAPDGSPSPQCLMRKTAVTQQ